ncbi:unnamed protein product, partial [Musa acuminata var. zebrina]
KTTSYLSRTAVDGRWFPPPSLPPRASRASFMLEDIMECILCNLHKVQKSLHFWQSRAE